MSYHDRQCSCFNSCPVCCTVGRHPGITVHTINRSYKMLVSFILSIAWKMLDCSCQSKSLNFFDISFAHVFYSFRVRAKRSCICNRVSEVTVNIDDWSKCPVCTNCSCLSRTGFCHFFCHCDIVSCSNFHRRTDKCTLLYNPISTLFQICCDQHRNFASFLNRIRCIYCFFSWNHSVHTCSRL